MLIEIVSNCAFSLELRRKKWQQWFRYNDILNFRMCSKRMKRQKKRIYCSVFIDFVLFLHSTNWICTIHIHICNVPKTAPLFFFSFFAKIKANILLATFNPTKQGIIECWQPIKKKTILYASFVVQVPFIYEHTWVFLFNLYTIKSDILKSATEISTGKVFNKTFAWCVSALPNV